MKLRSATLVALALLAFGGCGDDDRAPAADGGPRADAEVSRDAGAILDAAPDAEIADATSIDVVVPVDSGAVGRACASDPDCTGLLCGPSGRCGAFAVVAATDAEAAPSGPMAAALSSDGRAIVAFTASDGSVRLAQENDAGWIVRTTGLYGAVAALSADPLRIAACDDRLYVATSGAVGGPWTAAPIDGAPDCPMLDAIFIGGELLAASVSGAEVRVLRRNASGVVATELADTLPTGSLDVSVPRIAITSEGVPSVALSVAIPTAPGATSRVQALRLATKSGGAWSAASILEPVERVVGCLAAAPTKTHVGLQGGYDVSLVYDDAGAWLTLALSDQRGDGMRCGLLPDGILASTDLDPTTLVLAWKQSGALATARVETTPAAYGCALGIAHHLFRDAGGRIVWVTATAPTSAHTGDECRLTAIRFEDGTAG